MSNAATTITPDTTIAGWTVRWNTDTQLWESVKDDEVYADFDTLSEAAAGVRESIIDEGLCPDCADEGTETNTINGTEYGYDRLICPVNECRWMLSDG